MKQMIYKEHREKEILHSGTYKGYNFHIISYGTHPCAYVEIPKLNSSKSEFDECISCHGGVTYTGDLSHVLVPKNPNHWFIGWDYAHSGDYVCSPFPSKYDKYDKKWTTEEILKEVTEVIDQIIKLDKEGELKQ